MIQLTELISQVNMGRTGKANVEDRVVYPLMPHPPVPPLSKLTCKKLGCELAKLIPRNSSSEACRKSAPTLKLGAVGGDS